MDQNNTSQSSQRSGSSPVGGDRIEIVVKSVMQGVAQITLDVPKDIPLRELKQAIYERNDISVERQTLMYKTVEMKDDNMPLTHYGITGNCEITLNVKMSAGLNRRAATSDVVLYVPAMLPSGNSNMDQLRSMIKGMGNKRLPARRTVKTNPEFAKSSIWTPEKQMEHELTRNRMKALLKQRRNNKSTILSNESATPDGGSIIGSAARSPLESQPPTPPGEKTCSSASSASNTSVTSDNPVTEKELKLYFPAVESENHLESMRKDLYTPPQDFKEWELLKNKLEKQAKSRCKVCRRKLPLREQLLLCKCEKVFCSKHRAPEAHQCAIDYKNTGRNKLIKENPKIDGGGARKAKLANS